MGQAKHPWEQRKGESPAAYRAFRFYLERGPERTIDDAWKSQAPLKHQNSTSRAPGSWKLWSGKHEWVSRVLAWDVHIKSVQDSGIKKGVEKESESQGRRWQKQRDILNEKTLKHAMTIIDQAGRLVGLPVIKKVTSKDGTTVIFEPLPIADLKAGASLLMRGDAAARTAIADGLQIETADRRNGVLPDEAMNARDEAAKRLEEWRADQRAKILGRPGEPPE